MIYHLSIIILVELITTIITIIITITIIIIISPARAHQGYW